MYGSGSGTDKVIAPVLGVATAAVLPQTGVNTSIELALAAAAGLVVWAMVYGVMTKYKR